MTMPVVVITDASAGAGLRDALAVAALLSLAGAIGVSALMRRAGSRNLEFYDQRAGA